MKIYGIDFNVYDIGEFGGRERYLSESRTSAFFNEHDLLIAIAELKENRCVGEIKPFIGSIVREEEYKI